MSTSRWGILQFFPVENDLAAVARRRDTKTFFEIFVAEAMRNDRVQVEAGL